MGSQLNLLPRRDVIIFATADWDNPFRTNKQIIAQQFSKRGYKTLYVDSLGLRKPSMSKRDMGRMGRRFIKAARICKQVQENLWVASPLCLPGAKNGHLAKFSNSLLKSQLKMAIRMAGLHSPLVWTYNPTISWLIDALPHRGVIYHCVDALDASPGIDAEIINRGEKELGSRADACFVTSRPLKNKMKLLFSKVIYEPNGSDFSFFATTPRLRGIFCPVLKAIPGPRLLFVGAISDYKLDFDLLENMALARPEWNWIFLGQEKEGDPNSKPLPRLPNIHYPGPCLHGQLPYIMAQCDAAVMPIPRNGYTDAMFPMKFFEFLAADLPVICTRLPSLSEFENLYFPCENENDFLQAIESVLKGARKDAEETRKACIHNSWDARFARMEKALEEIGES